MEIIGIALMVGATAVLVVSDTMILIQAFKKSLWWGFGSLFIPFVQFVFVIQNWDETKKYVLWFFLALLLLIAGGSIK